MSVRSGARCHDQTAIRRTCEGRDGALDFIGIAYIDWIYFHSEQRGRALDDRKLAVSGALGGIPKNRYPVHVRRHLLEQFQPFPGCAVFHTHEPPDGTARPRPALDDTGADWLDD